MLLKKRPKNILTDFYKWYNLKKNRKRIVKKFKSSAFSTINNIAMVDFVIAWND